MDRKEIIKKLLMGPVDWITLTPFLLGITLGMGVWALSLEPGITLAASVILLLISAGIYLHRLFFGWNENYEKIVMKYRNEIEKKRDRELNNLYSELKKDGDARTETLLKDLRTLTKALLNEQSSSLAVDAFDIVADVDKLFQKSVDYLKESLELWKTATKMERESIKNELMKQREILIEEVEKSLENLGNVLGTLKKVSINSSNGQQLAELREELNTRLKIAEDVETRISSLRSNRTSTEDEEKYLKYACKQ